MFFFYVKKIDLITQNRAFHGSKVVFKIIEEDNRDNKEKDNTKENNIKKTEEKDPSLDKTNKQEEKKINENEKKEDENRRFIGSIVYIEENPFENREIIGKIKENKQSKGDFFFQNYWFYPYDKKLPWFLIHKAPESLIEEYKTKKISDYYFAGKFVKWDKDTMNPKLELTRKIG